MKQTCAGKEPDSDDKKKKRPEPKLSDLNDKFNSLVNKKKK